MVSNAVAASDRQQECEHLANVLDFLAALMEYPTEQWLDQDTWQALRNLLEQLGWSEAVAQLVGPMESEETLSNLQIEYTRLFINAIPHVIAPPYGSVYTDKEGILYGPSAEKTKTFYHEQGYDLCGPNDIPDHLNLELRFMALLLRDHKYAEVDLFTRQCFLPWFGMFRARVERESHHPYYPILVQLIDFFTKEEEEHVS